MYAVLDIQDSSTLPANIYSQNGEAGYQTASGQIALSTEADRLYQSAADETRVRRVYHVAWEQSCLALCQTVKKLYEAGKFINLVETYSRIPDTAAPQRHYSVLNNI